MMAGKEITLIIVAYLLGCVTGGYYLVRWRTGADIRQMGSGNVGAKNVGRVLGVPGFLGTFLIDFGKGALAVLFARYFAAGPYVLIAVLLAVVAGHNWPIQLRFTGGKGVATSLGAVLAYDPLIGAALVAAFVPVFLLIRNFTLSGLFAFALSPLIIRWGGLGNEKMVAMSLLAIVVLLAHRRNIREELARLSAEREAKGSRSSAQARRLHHEV